MTDADKTDADKTEMGAPEASALADAASEADIARPDPFVELEALHAETATLKDRLLRTMADMENMRRRADKELADQRIYATTNFARDMLSFADNLRRALDSLGAARAEASPALRTFIQGVEVIERDFHSRLARFNVKPIDAQGQKFDPNLHEALFEAADPSVPSGTVAQVVEAGYTIGERVLRPAKVGVARGGPKA